MDLTYVIGEPGVGKTTLLAAATDGLEWYMGSKPFVHIVYEKPNVAELGPRKANGFSGTDGLSMSASPKVVDWLKMSPFPFILGEGDRLSSDKFFEAVVAQGHHLTVVHLFADEDVMRQRREERAAGNNMPIQNESWVKGRQTKVSRLADTWALYHLDVTHDPPEIVLSLLGDVPVFKQLQEARA